SSRGAWPDPVPSACPCRSDRRRWPTSRRPNRRTSERGPAWSGRRSAPPRRQGPCVRSAPDGVRESIASRLALLKLRAPICRRRHANKLITLCYGAMNPPGRKVNRCTFHSPVIRAGRPARTIKSSETAPAAISFGVKTMDSALSTSGAAPGALMSPAAERNSADILNVLRAHLPARGRVLEIAAGSGQHAAAFAAALPGLDWTLSDPSAQARASIEAWRTHTGLANLRPAQAVDMLDDASWPSEPLNAIVCI